MDLGMMQSNGGSQSEGASFTETVLTSLPNYAPLERSQPPSLDRRYSDPEMCAAQSLLKIQAGCAVSFGFAAVAPGCFGAWSPQPTRIR